MGSFPQVPHQNRVRTYPFPIRTTCPSHLMLLDLITRIKFREEYRQLWGVQTIMRSTDNYEEYRQLWGVQTIMRSTDNYEEYRQLCGVQTIMWSTDNYEEYRQLCGVQTIMWSTDNYEEYRQLWRVQTIMWSTDNYVDYRQLWGVQTIMWSTDNYVEYRQLWGVRTIMWSTDNYVEYRQLWGVQTIMRSAHNYEKYRQLTFLLCSFLNSPGTSSLLGPNILLSTLFSNSLSLRSSHAIGDPVSHPYKTRGKIILLYILNFIFLDRKLEDQRLCAEWQQTFPEFSLFLIYSWMEILLFRLIPDIWTVPPVQRNYCQS